MEKHVFDVDEDGYVSFGDVSRQLMDQQCKYGCRYIDGAFGDYPKLGENLRFRGNTNNYHSLRIHKDDINEFMSRYDNYMFEYGCKYVSRS